MSPMSMKPDPIHHQYGQGKRKLLEAAARLAARDGAAALSVRALAQEAGLSTNAIYRHFDSVERLMIELIADVGVQLREGLHAARLAAPSGQPPSRVVVGWLLDFALAHPDAFVVSMRERHGALAPAREAIEASLTRIRQEMLVDFRAQGRLPALSDQDVDLALRVIIDQTFGLCLQCIEAPQRRSAILAEAELIFMWVLSGAATVSARPASA